MKLTRIRIEQFRRFRQPFEIADLEPGLNLFTGPNEAGKSTLVAAIRAAFFERHRSSSVDDLRPWSDSAAVPTVELEFTIGDDHYRLGKSFLGRKRCELQSGARRLEGADAEDHLAELLGFQHAGKGASKPEHWGIPGLLWIQQGSAQDIREPVGHATDHLRNALNESLGEVASSGGDEVVARVLALRNELLTPATGAPKGAYAEANRKQAELATALSALDDEIAGYRQQVDSLADLRRAHAADEAERPWEGFRASERTALAELEAARNVQTTLEHERRRAAQIDAQAQLLREQLERFAGEECAAKLRGEALDAAGGALDAANDVVRRWQEARAQAAARHVETREALRRARQEDARQGLARQADELVHEARARGVTLEKAETEQATLNELRLQAAASALAADDLAILREQASQLRELYIRQAAAATTLRFALDAGREIRVGAEALAGSGERHLVEATALVLPGLGRLDISPGGDADLAELRRDQQVLADRHVDLLRRLGLASLDAAETRHQTHVQLRARLVTAEATLRALAPQGIEALRVEVAGNAARARELEQALAQLPPATSDAEALPVASAEAAEEAARRSLEQIDASLNQARIAAGNAQTVREAAIRELAAARALLDASDREARQAAAKRQLVDALAEQAALAVRIEELAAQVALARPDILAQDVERFRRSAEQHERRYAERRDMLLRLEVALHTAGARGLEEQRGELARNLEQARRRAGELQRRARALDHLLRLLQDKRQALTRRLQAPLQKHLNHYLQLLFPRASLEIDENLSPGPLRRLGADGVEAGDFEALSFGAREQMGVISRLAYADLLQEAGRPTLIILDDALVHSDEARLASMKRVLFDAATRHQILLFTCHPGNWRDLGVAARALETPRAPA